MNAVYRGKIGRLPVDLREKVNRRLEIGEPGTALLAWLNGLPEVKAMLAAEFDGMPIKKQNLSKWRKFGFKDWLRRREAQAMAAEIGELPVAGNSPVTSQMTAWASVRYLMAVRELVDNQSNKTSNLATLRQFTHDVIALRRADHRTARLEFDQERIQYKNINQT